MNKRYKSVFFSDSHLGSVDSKARHLTKFLDSIECDNLFVLGDLIDGWVVQETHYWPQRHTDAIRSLLKKTECGTVIRYVIGNHDEFVEKFLGNLGDQIQLLKEYTYETCNKKFILTHGHEFDYFIEHMKFIGVAGSIGYEYIKLISKIIKKFRKTIKRPKKTSIAEYIKDKVDDIVELLSKFEQYVIEYAYKKNMDGVICGHIHEPSLVQKNNLYYFNCGDFVKNCTAIAEDYEGNFSLIDFKENEAKIIKTISMMNG